MFTYKQETDEKQQFLSSSASLSLKFDKEGAECVLTESNRGTVPYYVMVGIHSFIPVVRELLAVD